MTMHDDSDSSSEDQVVLNEADHMKGHALEELRRAHDGNLFDGDRSIAATMAVAYATLALHAELRDSRLGVEP